MKIALFINTKKEKSLHIALSVAEFLSSHGVEVFVDEHQAETLNAKTLDEKSCSEIDFLITLGGDGTILQAIHEYPDLKAPILGINLGSLGFMADIPIAEIYPSLQDLMDGSYRAERRIMMEGVFASMDKCFAVNDIVIHRAQNPTLVDLAIHVDGAYLNTFSADGIIIATPSGSTAYSLAAGGPIITPEIEAFVITPISPHTISNRPIVIMPKKDIQIQYLSAHDPVEVTADGFAKWGMKTGEVFHIRRHSRDFSLISLLRHDYFGTLRSKLGWAGKLKQ